MPRTLVLAGGGHAHIQVLTSKCTWPTDLRRVIVSSGPIVVYSGMMPSIIAGLLPPSDAEVSLKYLAQQNGWEFIDGRVTSLSAANQILSYAPNSRTGTPGASRHVTIKYDFLSLDVGSKSRNVPILFESGSAGADSTVMSRGHDDKPTSSTALITDAGRPALSGTASVDNPSRLVSPTVVRTRPIISLLSRIRAFEIRAHTTRVVRVVIIGFGAAGAELAFSIHNRFSLSLSNSSLAFTIVDSSPVGAQTLGPAAETILAQLRARGITVRSGERAVGVKRNEGLVLESGDVLPCEMLVVATGPVAHEWLAEETDLQLDKNGFVIVEPTLHTRNFPNVFAVGDCCSFDGHFGENFPPKAGVYAVRMGHVLQKSLCAVVKAGGTKGAGSGIEKYMPQKTYLSLMATGDGRAVGTKWNLVVHGRWVYKLKEYIDATWQMRFRPSKFDAEAYVVKETYLGSSVEAAVILMAHDHESEDFSEQHAVLLRMDKDEDFRNEVLDFCDKGSRMLPGLPQKSE